MKFYKTDWFLKVISLLISVVIWIYVVYEQNPQYELWIKDIPVTQNNVNTAFKDGKLQILENDAETIDIKIKGNRKVVSGVNSKNVKASIDMIGVTREGAYTLPVSVNFPTDGVEILQKNPYNASIKVDKVISSEKDITVEIKGDPREGFIVEENTLSPTSIKVTGPQTIIESISKASVTVDVTGVYDDISGLYKIKLYDVSGKEIQNDKLIKNIEYTDLKVSVLAVAGKNIVPTLSATKNSDGKTVTATVVSPALAKIKGKQDVLSKIQNLSTQTIDVSSIFDNSTVYADIILPEGVEFFDNSEKLTVEIQLNTQ